jgi:hypothetical protein
MLIDAALHVGIKLRALGWRERRDFARITRRTAGPFIEVGAVEQRGKAFWWLIVFLGIRRMEQNNAEKGSGANRYAKPQAEAADGSHGVILLIARINQDDVILTKDAGRREAADWLQSLMWCD